jgi:hypothetical protein
MRLLRTCFVALALSCAALAVSASSAQAGADSVHAYTLVVSPATVAGGSSTTFTFALTNTSSARGRLGSVNLTPPSGFQVTAVSLPKGSAGTAAVAANVVQLRRLAMNPKTTVNISVTATAPESCGTTSYTWGSAALVEPNFTGTPLTLNASASSLSTSVTTACALQFSTQPHSAVVGQTITGADFDPTGPPITVELVDGNGNLITSSAAPVTIALANSPSGAALSGTTTVDASGGVATFSDLTINQPADGYTLAASSPGATGTTSTPFDETTTAASCPQNQTCQTSITTPVSEFTVTAIPSSGNPSTGTLSESLDVGTPLQCPGYTAEDSNWFGFFLTTADRRKLITYTVRPTGQGPGLVGSTQFCFGASAEFTTSSGPPAGAGTLPDGSSGFIGLLPTCPAGGPCISSRGTTPDPSSPTGFDIVLTAEIPASFAGDPWGRA